MPFFLVFTLIRRAYVRVYLTLFIIFILLAIAFVFGSQNSQLITLNYLIARTEMTVAAAVSIFTGIGFVLGLLVTLCWRLIRRSKKAFTKNKSQET